MQRDIFCANSHFIEPSHVYEGRMPRKWQDRAPRIVDNEGGGQKWIFEGRSVPLRGSCCAVITPREKRGGLGDLRYDEMFPGFYDPKARLADMDIDGVAVTACYSSPAGIGFGGDLFHYAADPELGLASMRAYNDWYHEEWVGAAPDRFVPIGCAWYGDPQLAADEVRRNAARGFKGVMFRNPVDLDLPWVGSGYWDPFFAACEETQTAIIHHTQALETWPRWPSGIPGKYPYVMRSIMFQSCAMEMVLSWLWGGVPARFPDLKIMIAESGGTWLPHLLWRMDWAFEYAPFYVADWPSKGKTPLEVMRESMVFGTLEIDTAIKMKADHGIDGWMIETDYPHNESVWPESQKFYTAQLQGLSADDEADLRWRNASRFFRHEMPAFHRAEANA